MNLDFCLKFWRYIYWFLWCWKNSSILSLSHFFWFRFLSEIWIVKKSYLSSFFRKIWMQCIDFFIIQNIQIQNLTQNSISYHLLLMIQKRKKKMKIVINLPNHHQYHQKFIHLLPINHNHQNGFHFQVSNLLYLWEEIWSHLF